MYKVTFTCTERDSCFYATVVEKDVPWEVIERLMDMNDPKRLVWRNHSIWVKRWSIAIQRFIDLDMKRKRYKELVPIGLVDNVPEAMRRLIKSVEDQDRG